MGVLGALAIGLLEDYLNFIFSILTSWVRGDNLPLLFKLLRPQLVFNDLSRRRGRRWFLLHQHQKTETHADLVDLLGRIDFVLPLVKPHVLRFRHFG